jgi:hypothetical protein
MRELRAHVVVGLAERGHARKVVEVPYEVLAPVTEACLADPSYSFHTLPSTS